MHPYKKNIILIFLVCLVAMPLLYSVYTIIEKKMIEHRMEEKLAHVKLSVITMDASSVIWLKKNKEILVNGEPFDIKSITRNGNEITVTGLYDQQEKKLKRQIEAYHHSKNRSASANNSLLLLFFTTYFHTNESIDLSIPFFVHKKQPWQNPGDKTCKLYIEILIPPPRNI